MFVGARDAQLRRSNFSKAWARALAKAGLPGELHFHDLRHTGNTLTGEASASLAGLMSRMGHASPRAARVYLHAREERDRHLAAALDKLARRELRRSAKAKIANRSVARSTARARFVRVANIPPGCEANPGEKGPD